MAQVKEFVLKALTGDAQANIDKVKGGLDDATASTGKLSGGFKKANFSVKAFGKALIATGIGAFVVAIGALVSNLQNSEDGFNRVQKVLKQLGVIAGNVTDIFYSLGTSLFSLITGDFDQMNKSFEEATNRIKNFGEETKREIELQGDLADKQADLVKLERELVVERAEANRKRADLLEKAADKENFTASERIKFLEEAGKIDSDITNKEIEAAKIRLQLKEQENTLSESSAEDLNEEARLKAELTNLETARLTKQKTVTAQITSALKEEQAERKAITTQQEAERKADEAAESAKIKADADKELARLTSIQTIRDSFKMKSEDLEAETEAQKLELQKQRDLASLEALGATEAQKLEVKKYYASLENDLNDKSTQEAADKQKAVEGIKRQQAKQTLNDIAMLAGEGSEIGKAAALASATISGIEGVQNAYTTAQSSPITAVFPGYPIVQAGLAAAFSAKQIQSIVATPKSGKGGSTTPSTGPRPPAFNVVGSSPVNQLAETLNNRDKQPVKAFVVSQEISSQQALDRNIEQQASLG